MPGMSIYSAALRNPSRRDERRTLIVRPASNMRRTPGSDHQYLRETMSEWDTCRGRCAEEAPGDGKQLRGRRDRCVGDGTCSVGSKMGSLVAAEGKPRRVT